MSLLPGQSTFARIAPAIFVFLWSTGFVGARFGLPYAEPMTFTSIRFAIVVVLLSVIVACSRNRLPRSPTMCGHLAVSGILIHACYIGGVFIAIDVGVDISIAAIIVGAQPLLTAVVVVLFMGETLSRRQWAGFVVGFLGLVMVVAKTFAIGALPACRARRLQCRTMRHYVRHALSETLRRRDRSSGRLRHSVRRRTDTLRVVGGLVRNPDHRMECDRDLDNGVVMSGLVDRLNHGVKEG